MFLARKITRAKWESDEGLSKEEISADAVTADLRTSDNALSFWKCEPTSEQSIEDVALAIVANGSRIDKVELVWLTEDKLLDDGQTLENSKGKTPFAELVNQHFDVSRLDYVRLGKVAHCVVDAINANQYRRLRKKRVAELLATAIVQGRIDPNSLHEKIREELRNKPATKT